MTLLDEPLRERAREALDALSTGLLAAAVPVDDASLGTGASGLALTHAYLASTFPDRAHGEASERAVGSAIERAGRGASGPWLFGGLAGVGWVIDHLTQGDPADGDPSAAIEGALLRLVTAGAPQPWELVHGLAGLVVYAAPRAASRPRARVLLEGIGRALVAAASSRNGHRFWTSEPRWDPIARHAAPYENFGFAHGIPGALAAATVLIDADVLADELSALVRDVAAWLLTQQTPANGARFRGTSDDRGVPARTAWCYGDPGVAWSLCLAARALGDDRLKDDALALATLSARRPASATGVVDACLCHGAAGLGHIYHRMSRLYPDQTELAEAARLWFARALDLRTPDAPLGGFRFLSLGGATRLPASPAWNDDASFLNGAAGVALALVSALDPEAMAWDEALLLGSQRAATEPG